MVRHARVSWNPRDDGFDPYVNIEESEPKPIRIPKRRKRQRRREMPARTDRDDDPDNEPRDP